MIKLSRELPVVVEYKCADMGYVRYYLAPKVRYRLRILVCMDQLLRHGEAQRCNACAGFCAGHFASGGAYLAAACGPVGVPDGVSPPPAHFFVARLRMRKR